MGREYKRAVSISSEVPSMYPVLYNCEFREKLDFEKKYGDGGIVKRVINKGMNKSIALWIQTEAPILQPAETSIDLYSFAGVSSSLRFELVYNLDSVTHVTAMIVRLDFYNGTELLCFMLKYDTVNNKWQYNNSAGAWEDVIGGGQVLASKTWNVVAFKMDLHKCDYISMESNGLAVSMSGIKAKSQASTAAERVYSNVQIMSSETDKGSMYVDRIIMYQD